MLPPWMIEKLEQERREREAREQEQPRLEIEAPRDVQPGPERTPTTSSSVCIIQVW